MKPNNFLILSIVIFINMCWLPAQGQQNYVRFKRLTINDGLSLSSVYVIFQDSKGFMWFGTEDGLNKYDGKRFRIFRPDPANPNSLSYKWTELIYEDSSGNLWFGSKGGLSKFDPKKEIFTRYGIQNQANRLISDTITCLNEAANNNLWIGTISGINMMDLNSNSIVFSGLTGLKINTIKSFADEIWIGTNKGIYIKSSADTSFHYLNISKDSTTRPVYSILKDNDDAIWAGLGNKLYKSSSQSDRNQWECMLDPEDYNIQIDQIEKLVFNEEQNIWISSDNGLYKFDLNKRSLLPIIRSIDSSHSLAINPSKSLRLDHSGALWYGTFGDGIYRIDPKTNRFTNFRNNPGDLQSVSENAINCMFEDRSGNIWFGTFGAGINIYLPEAHKFGYMCHQALNANSLSSNFIWSILECENGSIMVGTNDAGLNIYDPVTNRYQYLIHDPNNQNSLSNSSVRKIYQDSKHRIWIGTDGGGLNRYFPETKRFVHYMNIPGDSASISSNSVRVIYEDNESRLWIGTRSGLNLFNPESGKFLRYVHRENDPTTLSNDFVYSAIFQDKKGNLWIGTYGGGLNKMNISSGEFQAYVNNPMDLNSISDNIVFSMYEDPNEQLWVGTNSGLNKLDPESGIFQRFGIRNGLPNEVIYGILPDAGHNLWLSTNKGICRFNVVDYATKNFTINDGLQSNEFNGGAFYKGNSGRMYFGGVYGLNIIDPDLAYIEENNSQMSITNIAILGEEVSTSPDSLSMDKGNKVINRGGHYTMPINVSYAEEIILDYKHRFITIEYAALNSPNTDELRIQYRMEGLNENWNDVGNRFYITFANLQPGNYQLNIRSFNADNFQGLADAQLKIMITPPFWKTWWFYLLEACLAFVILSFIYKYLLKIRTNRLLRTQNEKIFQANQKLQASEKDLRQLNATKDKFFSIISHDLKNPFTSLLSISELMATDYKNLEEEEKEQGIKGVHDSATRIYNLLENLLTWSRSQTGKIIYNPARFDIKELIDDNIMLHYEQAAKKHLNIEFSGKESILAHGDSAMISTVIRNLLSNAIKFTPDGRTIKILAEDVEGKWKISIIDQGVGLSVENREKIFQIEKKFKTEGTSGEKGTGLGLLICKEFVEKNGGTLVVESKEGEGSNFNFTIPKWGQFVK